MAGDVVIADRIVEEDFKNLKKFDVRYTVLLDLTHDKATKPAHLDFELDFGQIKEPNFQSFLSNFKQNAGKTFKKLLFGKFDPQKKRMSAKYEAAAFSPNVFNKAKNARDLKDALRRWNAGQVMEKMLEVQLPE